VILRAFFLSSVFNKYYVILYASGILHNTWNTTTVWAEAHPAKNKKSPMLVQYFFNLLRSDELRPFTPSGYSI